MNRSPRLLGAIAIAAFTLSGCTDAAGYDLDNLLARTKVLSMLRETPSYQPYDMPRLPAPGSVPSSAPLGESATFTQLQLDSVGAVLANPLPATPEVIARGQIVYERQCSVCHGVEGDGAGTVVGPGRFPPSTALREAPTAARSDGYIYAVTRVGRGLMPAYGDRVSHDDRWAVVHYIRQLQGGLAPAAGAPPAGTQPVDETPGAEFPAAVETGVDTGQSELQ